MSVSPSQQNRFAWAVVLILFIGSIINYIDRTALSVVMPQVREDLNLSNTQYGVAVQVFLIAYTLFYILGGRIADRLGARRTFTLMLVFWSVSNMLHAFARGLFSLSLYRGLLGIGEGGFYPNAVRGAGEWFGPENRAKAIGLFMCGISLGTVFAPPAVAWITLLYGWRAAFVLTGALGLVLVPPWLYVHRRIAKAYGTPDPAPAYSLQSKTASVAAAEIKLREVLVRSKYWLLVGTRAAGDTAWYFYLFWIAAYFQDVRGFSLAQIGSLLWIPYLSASVGSLAGAWASSGLIRRGWSLDRSRKSVLFVSALLCMTGVMTYFVPGANMALFFVSVTLFGHFSWSSNIHTAITEVSPQQHMAVLYGITGAAGTLLGAISQPVIGGLIDLVGYAPVFIGAGSAYVLALVLLFVAGKIEPIQRKPAELAPAST